MICWWEWILTLSEPNTHLGMQTNDLEAFSLPRGKSSVHIQLFLFFFLPRLCVSTQKRAKLKKSIYDEKKRETTPNNFFSWQIKPTYKLHVANEESRAHVTWRNHIRRHFYVFRFPNRSTLISSLLKWYTNAGVDFNINISLALLQ